MYDDKGAEKISRRWFIDLKWLHQNNRSFLTLAQSCLCPECQQKVKGEAKTDDIIATIKRCCSKAPGFITPESPVLESMFRIVLANGNRPLYLEELETQLTELRSISHRPSAKTLSRLLQSDRHYGLRETEA